MPRLPEDADEAEAVVKDLLFTMFLAEARITREAFAALSPVARAAVVDALLAMTKAALHGGKRVSTSVDDMDLTQRLNVSRGQKPGDDFMEKARAKRFTMTSLAKRVGISTTLLSLYRSGKRPCPIERAQKIEDLIQWPADAKHWPGGLLS